jgi:hypothetical protein
MNSWLWNVDGMMLIAENPNPVPIFPPLISHGLAWEGIRTSAVRDRRHTAWTMALPLWILNCGNIYIEMSQLCPPFILASGSIGTSLHCDCRLAACPRVVTKSQRHMLLSKVEIELTAGLLKKHQAYDHNRSRKTNLSLYYTMNGARGGAVGWGTAPQEERSRLRFPMMWLEFFINIILPAVLWSWGRFSP